MHKTIILFLVGILITAAFAQDQAKGQAVVMAPPATVVVTKGKPGRMELAFRVAPGYHINSNQPRNELLIPTALKLDPPTDVLIAKLAYPEGHDITFAWLPGEKLNVYTGDFAISGMVSTSRTIPLGTYKVRGQLKYQACDDRQCYQPKLLPLEFDIRVQRAASGKTARGSRQSPHIHR